jgi:AcrR family transcriptional regulator
VGRWEPDASGRLQQAALELYHEQGYEQTTVAQIAQRAGLTTRTYFRHYADKREVLFSGEDALHELLVLAIAGAAESTAPMEAFAAGLKPAMTVYFQQRSREAALQRHQIIAANAALQERESLKLSRLATSVAAALRERGMAEPAATLTAETGVIIFKVAVERWITDTADRDLSYHIDSLVTHLKALVGTE